jgi:hypothetical protein
MLVARDCIEWNNTEQGEPILDSHRQTVRLVGAFFLISNMVFILGGWLIVKGFDPAAIADFSSDRN